MPTNETNFARYFARSAPRQRGPARKESRALDAAIRDQLVTRAIRILTDDNDHAETVTTWASRTLAAHQKTAEGLLQQGFTERELSLGATPW